MLNAQANARVQALLDRLVAEDGEAGLQVAAYHDGALVIDAWAGIADAASGRPVQGDTLFTSFSMTKGPVASAVHMLAERGKLDYDAKVAAYWPEYAQNGKEATTLRHVLTHREGIPQVPAGVTPELLADWDEICRRVAAETAIWEPGTHTGYHAYVYGWILGEVVRRVDGRPIDRFIVDEITGPLGIADWYLGMPDEIESRMATLITAPLPPDWPAVPRDALLFRAMPLDIFPAAHVYNRRDVRKAVIPAGGGIMSARGIARHYAALAAAGSLDGVRILSPEQLKLATTLQDASFDEVLGRAIPRGLGYWLGEPTSPMGPRQSAFGHGGAGGSIAFADPEYNLAVGFTKNLLRSVIDPANDPGFRICNELRAALGIPNALHG